MSRVEKFVEPESTQSLVQDDIVLTSKPFFYTWTLRNFSECLKFTDAKIISPEFVFADENWRLQLRAASKNGKLEKIKIRLVKSEKSASGFYINCKFSLSNAHDTHLTKQAASSFHGKTVFGRSVSFRYSEKKASFLIRDKLTVNCDFLVLSSFPAASDDQVSLSLKESDNLMPEDESNEAKPLSSSSDNKILKGRIRSRSRMPKLSRKSGMYRSVSDLPLFPRPFDRILGDGSVLQTVLSFWVVILLLMTLFRRAEENEAFLSNMTEVNELILDSTFKIWNIAEALNLTDVKNKSSELLMWYHENYNISDRDFRILKEKILPYIVRDQILNTSDIKLYNSTLANNAKIIKENL